MCFATNKTYFKDKCTLEECIAFSDTFLPLYLARKENNTELCFITDELPQYFAEYGVPLPEDLEEIEYQFLEHMKEDILLEEVKETLEALREKGIPMYVFSNSISTGRAASRHIAKFGILPYFEKVYSSGDYGVKKPGKEFFQIAINEILEKHPDFKFYGSEEKTVTAKGLIVTNKMYVLKQQQLETIISVEIPENAKKMQLKLEGF